MMPPHSEFRLRVARVLESEVEFGHLLLRPNRVIWHPSVQRQTKALLPRLRCFLQIDFVHRGFVSHFDNFWTLARLPAKASNIDDMTWSGKG